MNVWVFIPQSPQKNLEQMEITMNKCYVCGCTSLKLVKYRVDVGCVAR